MVNVVIPVQGKDNSVTMAPVRVGQVISSATAHASMVPSTTTTVGNAEMFVPPAQPVPQKVAFLTRDNFNIVPRSY